MDSVEVLIVEDEVRALKGRLEHLRYDVTFADNLADARTLFEVVGDRKAFVCDVMLLDLALNGLYLPKEYRKLLPE